MMQSLAMKPFGELIRTLPGFEGLPRGRAPSPVWRNSTTTPTKFRPIPKKEAARVLREAEGLERSTRQPGKQEGALGRSALNVLRVLCFDYWSDPVGHCEPAQETLATRACMSPSTVKRALAKLKAAGVLDWTRRCVAEAGELGGVVFRQLTNAYHLLPAALWRGHKPKPPAPPPDAGSWGEPARVLSVIEEAATATTMGEQVKALELDPRDGLAAALAGLARAIARPNIEVLPEGSL